MLLPTTGFWNNSGENPNAFILQIVGSSYTIPTVNGGTYSYDVDWGDGTTSVGITTWNASARAHTYPSSDEYIITITGTFHGIQCGTQAAGQRSTLREIIQWGNMRIGSFGQAFRLNEELISTGHDLLDVSMETSLDSLFRQCKKLESVPRSNEWNVENVVYMGSLNSDAHLLDMNVTDWNTPSLVKLGNTFYNSKFNRSLANWDVSNVDNFSDMLSTRVHGTISTTNYDATLISWAQQNVNSNMTIGVTGRYTLGGTAEAARNTLLGKGWTITDGGGI